MTEFKSFFKSVGGNEGNKCRYPHRLDSYGCGCSHDCKYCVSPDTQILMYNGTVKAIKDVHIGDEIYGVSDGETCKKFVMSMVTNKVIHRDKAYKITLSNGNTLICSGNHQWLTNRGWKYTIGAMGGENQRPYITTNNKLLGFSTLFNIDYYSETDDYKCGYLRGVILGDANFNVYPDYREHNNGEEFYQYHFRLALKNESITMRVKQYLSDFGVDTNDFEFPMIDRKTKESYVVTAIRTHSRENFEKIQQLIMHKDTVEFARGFLGGIYDAEGNNDIFIRRMYNADDGIIKEITNALNIFGFGYTFDTDIKTKNLVVKTVRLLGGVSENLRFGVITNCIVANGIGEISNLALKTHKSDDLHIISIEDYSDDMELVDITTTTRNFIANGVVSHNCYAKSLLDFRNLWNPENPSVADIEKVKKTIKKIANKGEINTLRLGGMTDCFQPIEREYGVTYEVIKTLNEYNLSYLIVTKSDLVADDKYMDVMNKDLAHIQVTVTTTDDDLSLTYEKAVAPSKRIKAIEKLQENGFDVALRLSPFIPQYVNYDILNAVKCDKIQVEFLRVNSWIQKWFDIDYSDYTVKQSGYRHLPLEKKKEFIKNINGFKEISVCEDESRAYEYWQTEFNPNPNDCCNLRNSKSVAIPIEHKPTMRLF